LPIVGSYMTEIEFFHRASRTLILIDLIENFEREKVGSFFLRLLTWIGGRYLARSADELHLAAQA
jgi:hypothetical protein